MVFQEEEITRLYRIRKTVMVMLRDRNYLVGDFEVNMSKHEFKEKYGENMKREDLVINKTKKDKPSDQIYVFFPEEVQVGVKTMKTYTNRMNSENVYRAILVCQTSLTPFARTCIAEVSSKFHLEVFHEAELLVNIKELLFTTVRHGSAFLSSLLQEDLKYFSHIICETYCLRGFCLQEIQPYSKGFNNLSKEACNIARKFFKLKNIPVAYWLPLLYTQRLNHVLCV